MGLEHAAHLHPSGRPNGCLQTRQQRPLHAVNPAHHSTHRARMHGITVAATKLHARPGWPNDESTPQRERPRFYTLLQPAGAATVACRVMYSPQPAAELHTSKQGEKRAWGDRVLSGITASHALARAPGVDFNRHCKHMRQHKPPGGRPTLLRRTDGALSAAASPAVARARSKARERALLRLPRLSSVRGAAYV